MGGTGKISAAHTIVLLAIACFFSLGKTSEAHITNSSAVVCDVDVRTTRRIFYVDRRSDSIRYSLSNQQQPT